MIHVDYLFKQRYQHYDYNLTGLESLTAPQNFVAQGVFFFFFY